jgi:hypothetical protein
MNDDGMNDDGMNDHDANEDDPNEFGRPERRKPESPDKGGRVPSYGVPGDGVPSDSIPRGIRSGPLPWPTDPRDPEGVAIAEAWSSFDQLIRDAGLTSLSTAAQARLVRAVERRSRHRKLVGWGAALAVAAAALIVLSIRREGAEPIARDNPPAVEKNHAPASSVAQLPRAAAVPPAVPGSSVTLGSSGSQGPRVAQTAVAAPAASSPVARTETTPTAANPSAVEFWSDQYDTDLQSTRLQAQEVELSWQRGSEPLTGLRQRFEDLQADWNGRAL